MDEIIEFHNSMYFERICKKLKIPPTCKDIFRFIAEMKEPVKIKSIMLKLNLHEVCVINYLKKLEGCGVIQYVKSSLPGERKHVINMQLIDHYNSKMIEKSPQ